jgi:rod shape-determining protein MreC
MRLRKRHAWGAVLIALFALPVLKPDGVPGVEEPAGGFFTWFSKVEPLNPRLWKGGDDGGAARDPDLERALAELWEKHLQVVSRVEDLKGLEGALELDRLPSVRLAKILRAHDPSTFRRSILIDRGTEDGVHEGYAVVGGGVLLGRVQVTRGRSSLVRLVTDPHSRLEVALRTAKGERVVGYLRRSGPLGGSDDLDVGFARVRHDAGPILLSTPVFTSNADPLLPEGLLVGYVTRVSDPDKDGMPVLKMRPALDLDRSAEALVLIPRDTR